MLILSQQKNKIVNFSNLIQIYITKDEQENYIRFETIAGLYDDLGIYNTKERAKEILQEIIKEYRDYRTAECDGYTNVLQETAVYEMPEK